MDLVKKYLQQCYQLAKESPDISNQNACIIVSQIHSFDPCGINTFPPGIEWNPEKIKDRDWKLTYIEHAERSSIYDAAKRGVCLEGSTMYGLWVACTDCARAIVLSGITKVVTHQQRMDLTPERWKKSVEAGLDIMRKGGVELEFWSGKIGCDPIIVNGELWYP